ncbi:MAG: class I SAM-dependent methyltransferase, partial [Myxococcota bacterium]
DCEIPDELAARVLRARVDEEFRSLSARKLDLKPRMRLLDIGCGWGGTAKFLAERYQVYVVGITVSEVQARAARERCSGLPVTVRVQDYREVRGRFDCVLSIGMFEHVGYKNYRQFIEVVHALLRPGGLLLLHTIGRNRSTTHLEPWMRARGHLSPRATESRSSRCGATTC